MRSKLAIQPYHTHINTDLDQPTTCPIQRYTYIYTYIHTSQIISIQLNTYIHLVLLVLISTLLCYIYYYYYHHHTIIILISPLQVCYISKTNNRVLFPYQKKEKKKRKEREYQLVLLSTKTNYHY